MTNEDINDLWSQIKAAKVQRAMLLRGETVFLDWHWGNQPIYGNDGVAWLDIHIRAMQYYIMRTQNKLEIRNYDWLG